MNKVLAAVFSFLFLTTLTSASFITPYGEEKNVTSVDIYTNFIGENKYNVSATLNRVVVSAETSKEEESDAFSGNIIIPGIATEPLKDKELQLFAYGTEIGSCTTDSSGECQILFDLNTALDPDEKCVEIYVSFEGDELNSGSKSSKHKLCKNEFISYSPAVSKVVESISEDADQTNICMTFFIMMGFLVAGMYASGKDPLRLLDITSPRLPAARKKPEIKLSIGENNLKRMREESKAYKGQVNGMISILIKKLAKEKAKKERKQIIETLAKKHNISRRKAEQLFRADIKRKIKQLEKSILRKLKGEINEIKKEYSRRINTETSSMNKVDAIRREKELTEEMYEKIAETLRAKSMGHPSLKPKLDKAIDQIADNAKAYALTEHLVNIQSLAERGYVSGKGTISKKRKIVEMIPVVGRAVRVAHNIIGFGGMPYRYGKQKYLTRKEIKRLQKEIAKRQASERELSEEERKEVAKLQAKLIEQQYKGAVLPDRVKDYAEVDMYLRELTKEILNAGAHRVVREIKKDMDEKVFDKWYGKMVAERDVIKRCREIIEFARKKHIRESVVDYAEVILNTVQKFAHSPLDNANKIIELAEEVYTNPEHFDEMITTQEDEIQRYIELSDFVDENVLNVCKKEGLEKGIEYFIKKSNMQTYEEIKNTHAAYIHDPRFKARIDDIKREMIPFMVYSKEFLGLIEYLRNKGALPSTISAEQLDKLRVYYARELANIEHKYSARVSGQPPQRANIIIKAEKEEKDEVQNRVINALEEIAPGINADSAKEYIGHYEENIHAVTEDVGKSLEKNESMLLKAIDEWAKQRALDRAVGVTKNANLEKDIISLTKRAVNEYKIYEQLLKNMKEYNESKRDAIVHLNDMLGGIVKDVSNMEATQILMQMDRNVRAVLFKSLLSFFKKMEMEREERIGVAVIAPEEVKRKARNGEYLYKEVEINGKKHVFIKGFVDPSEKDVINLLGLFNKMFPHRVKDLQQCVINELPKKTISNLSEGEKSSLAAGYINFYKNVEGYSILFPGLNLPYKAAEKFPWIFGSKSRYIPIPEDMAVGEILGPADKLVNFEIITEEGKVKIKAPDRKYIAKLRSFINWINIQSVQFIGGAYIGLLAEAAATSVMYTRHAEKIKSRLKYYKGAGTFAEDALRNEKLASALSKAYLLRSVLGKRRLYSDDEWKEMEEIMGPEIVKKHIIDEINNLQLSELKKSIENIDFSNPQDLDRAINLCSSHVGEYIMQEMLLEMTVKSSMYINEYKERLESIKIELKRLEKSCSEVGSLIRKRIKHVPLSIEQNEIINALVSEIEKAYKKPDFGKVIIDKTDKISHLLVEWKSKAEAGDKPKYDAIIHFMRTDVHIRAVAIAEEYMKLTSDRKKNRVLLNAYRAVNANNRFMKKSLFSISKRFASSVYERLKEKFTNEASDAYVPPINPKNKLIDEIYNYSKRLKKRRKSASPFEINFNARLRNIAYTIDSFLDHAYANMGSTLNAAMHTRAKEHGLDISSKAGYQFAGPITSSLLQRLGTYGKYGNKGWFTGIFLSFPIAAAERIYKKRYPLLHKLSQTPAVYEPMKSMNTGGFGYMEAFFYRKVKNLVAKMGELTRTFAKDTPPPAYFHYLSTANMFGETRISESLELLGSTFRSTPKGPRDVINYLLYKPNDLVMDFKDMVYSLKEGRSMKKTPEHLRDVGIYGVAANSKFIAGREIEYAPNALGGPASMYPQRAYNAFYSQPHLSLPGLRFSAYGDFYERTQTPMEVATEILHMHKLSKRISIKPLVIIPSLIIAPTVIPATYLFSIPFIWYFSSKMYNLPPRGILPKMLDWKTHKIIMDRYKNMYSGMYQSGG